MHLETPRLILRRWRLEDRAPVWALNSDPAAQRFLPAITREQSDAMFAKFEAHHEKHGFGYWALEERASGELIGACGMSHVAFDVPFVPAIEIGWRLLPVRHGRGLAREAAEAVLGDAFGRLALDRVVSFTTPANSPSWGLMERLDMKRIGTFEHPMLPEGDPLRHHVLYEIRRPPT